MNLKNLKNILIIASAIQTVLWVAGLVLANVTLVVLALITAIAILPVVYIHRNDITEMFQNNDEIVEDERTQLINEKSSTIALGAFIGTIIYVGLIIVSLRNVYPQFLVTGYVLLITALFGVTLSIISRTYYKMRYL
ncbi:DUF2178 domain-containing protein [Methanobacterium paludis]|uniref:DUF2178 domain-containing protein n=1 Tax=Methanobacterium paludis (strain DSM 25820 / JCM 18151 / SWAN1) TaxID=868131 RepID=F6D6M8_METPW|nr:DUF2178 domain-containing protein [Methanobacterium paludis]AEG17741.1 hypothetical protein MSWAN_0707 [Methanobacterium paludis]